MMRSCRSDCRVAISSSMIFGTVSASDRIAPVHDERLFLDDERGTADDHLAFLREVERDDRNVLEVDVLPDIDLGPVREREHADALAGTQLAVEQAPELGTLPLRIPLA